MKVFENSYFTYLYAAAVGLLPVIFIICGLANKGLLSSDVLGWLVALTIGPFMGGMIVSHQLSSKLMKEILDYHEENK